jgi:hypothetical protein
MLLDSSCGKPELQQAKAAVDAQTLLQAKAAVDTLHK